MVGKTGLKEIHQTIKNDLLEKMGIEDDFLLSILSYRLLIERIGEKKNNNWWDSKVFDEFGRKSLEDAVDKSVLKSQLKLAQKVGKKAEKEVIDFSFDRNQDYISLFYLGPYVEKRISAEIQEIDDNSRLRELEELEIEFDESGWSEKLIATSIEDNPYNDEDNAIVLGEISSARLESEERVKDILNKLVYWYGESTKNKLKVPCYEVNHE